MAEKTPARGVIGGYTSGQAQAIHGSIRWRFTTVRDWLGTHAPAVQRLPLRTLPSGPKGQLAPRKAAARWSVKVAHHLAARAAADGVTLGGGVFWPDAVDGLEPAAVVVYERLVAEDLAHHMVGHVRSSQAFALNLFAPLGPAGRVRVAAAAGIDAVEVSEPRFEWSDPFDELGERTHASPHATQVDVILDCVTGQGKKLALLVEVKLSEQDFGGCSAWLSPRNDRLDVCATTGPFGNDTALGPLTAPAATDEEGCWFRFGGNQPMRNVALARTLVKRGLIDEAAVALGAPQAHRTIWRRWAEAKAHLAEPGIALCDLPTEVVVGAHTGSSLSDRYLLERTVKG